MPGRTTSGPLRYVAVAFALVAVVGTLALGWEFGSAQPIPFVFGVIGALIALGVTLLRR